MFAMFTAYTSSNKETKSVIVKVKEIAKVRPFTEDSTKSEIYLRGEGAKYFVVNESITEVWQAITYSKGS